jgi:hypothetical protein
MTGEHPIDRYTNACNDLNVWRSVIESFGVTLGRWEQALLRIDATVFTDRAGKVGPASDTTAQQPSEIDFGSWPDLRELAAAIGSFREAQLAARGAYEALSIEQRSAIQIRH